MTPFCTNDSPRDIGRVCKHLAATETIREIDADLFAPTDYSESLIDPGRKAAVNQLYGSVSLSTVAER